MTDYIDGFQYFEGTLQFFPTAEGYVKNTEDSGHHFNYAYNYTDHLGNIRLSYGYDPEDQGLKILEENNYYPFGLKHNNYNMDYRDYVRHSGDIRIDPRVITGGEYKYKYQGQERQDELGLNWDSFKYRNYDYAIGRFMSVDPLAEDYVHNGVYNFAEDRVIDGRELEGCEWQSIKEYYSGMWEGAKETTSNFVKAVSHPINTVKAMASTPPKSQSMGEVICSGFGMGGEAMSTFFRAAGKAYDGDFTGAGNVAGSEVTSKVIEGALVLATEGAGKAIGSLGKVSSEAVSAEVSPNVQKALNTLNEIKADGGTVKINPMKANQELNMTVKSGAEKVDIRVESHPLPKKLGGDGVSPTRHLNVDMKGTSLPNKGHKILD